MRLDYVHCKGPFLQAFDNLHVNTAEARHCFQRILELPSEFGAEYAYNYLRTTFRALHPNAQYAERLQTIVGNLVSQCRMRNLPQLFFLLLHEGKRTEAEAVQHHPLFRHEITCQSDRFRCSMLMYTCLLYTSPSPRDGLLSRMPSSA